MTADTEPPPTATGLHPLFYKDPKLISRDAHGNKSLRAQIDFSFARTTNSIPLVAQEFVVAARHYPIVFSASEPMVPVAVLGFGKTGNLFIEADGSWSTGVYVPAYVRRYPFVFSSLKESDSLALCIDEASGLLEDGDANPLFVDGEPSEPLKAALQFCEEFQKHLAITNAFLVDLKAQDLLEPKALTFTAPDQRRFAVGGLQIVDEEKFKALPDEVFLAWRRKGWLPLIYCHLVSMSALTQLGERAAAQPTSASSLGSNH